MTSESVSPGRERLTNDVGRAIDVMLEASGKQLDSVMRRSQGLEEKWKDVGGKKRFGSMPKDVSAIKTKRDLLEQELRTLQMLSKCSDRTSSVENGDKPRDPKDKGEVQKLREELEYMKKRIDDSQKDLESERKERREAQENSQRRFESLTREHEAEIRRLQNEAEINIAKLKQDFELEADLRQRTNRLLETPQASSQELEGLLVAHKQELQKMESESAHMQRTISCLQSTLREAENVDRADRDILLSRVESLQALLDTEKSQRQEEVSGLYDLLHAQKKSWNQDLHQGACSPEISRNDDLRKAAPGVLDFREFGVIVARGPDWKWGDQDGGIGSKGITTDSGAADGWIGVAWENGNTQTYRIGAEGRFDLSINMDFEAAEREKSELLQELERLRGTEKALIAANETILGLRAQIEQDLKSMEDESFLLDSTTEIEGPAWSATRTKQKFEDLVEELPAVEGPKLDASKVRLAKKRLEEDLKKGLQRKVAAEDRVRELTGSASKESLANVITVLPDAALASPVEQFRPVARSRSVSPMDRASSPSLQKMSRPTVPPLTLPGNTSGLQSTLTSTGVLSPMPSQSFISVSPQLGQSPQSGQSPLWGTLSQSYSISPGAACSPNAPFPPAGLAPAVVLSGRPVSPFASATLSHAVELNAQTARPQNNRYARGVVRQSSDPSLGKATVRVATADVLSPGGHSSRFRTPGSWNQIPTTTAHVEDVTVAKEKQMPRAVSAPRLVLRPMSASASAPTRELVTDMVAPWIEPSFLRATKTPPVPKHAVKPLQFKRISVDEFEGTHAPQW